MKSTIKVDFSSRFGDGDFGSKEPLIKVDLISSDDPRDTLLGELFRETFPKLASAQMNPSQSGGVKTFKVFLKKRPEQLCDIASSIHSTLGAYFNMNTIMVTSYNEMYFEEVKEDNSVGVRSKGIDRGQYEYEDDLVFIKAFTQDFKDLQDKIKKRDKK